MDLETNEQTVSQQNSLQNFMFLPSCLIGQLCDYLKPGEAN